MRTALRLPLAAAFLLALPAASIAQQPAAPVASDAAARVRAIADEYVAAVVERFPGSDEALGAARSPDRWADASPAAFRAWEASEDAFLARLRAVDSAALHGTPEWVTYGMLREQLEASQGTRACRAELWNVSHLGGWHIGVSRALSTQRLGTPEHRARALARLRALSTAADVEIANLREGVRQGYTAPREAVTRALEQMDAMLPADPAASTFAIPEARDTSAVFRREWADALAAVYPALLRYRDFVRAEYLPRARAGAGLGAIPGGDACYRAMLRASTSLELDPAGVQATARAARAGIEAELVPLAQRLLGTTDVREARRRLRTERTWTSRDEMLAATRAQVEATRALLPRAFSRTPETPLVVEAAPAHEERSMPPAWYQTAPLDRSRPATYFINLYDAEHKPRMDMTVSTAHEGWPGHHFQIAWAQELPAPHPVARLLGTDAFVEGWGMYAERVAYEIGAAGDDLQKAGVLVHLADALVALEIDPGMHLFGWTRQQAVDSMMAISGRSRETAEVYADRHAATPTQLVTYMTGYLEIVRLREHARRALGERFDVREFHDRVLGHGAVTLPMLRETIDRWIAEKQRR